MKNRIILFILMILSCMLSSCSAQSKKPVTQVYAFGDSYTDNGNLAKLWGDPTFGGGYWQGRVSNGKISAEVLADQLKVKITNYAWAGARSGHYNLNSIAQDTGGLGQVEIYKQDLKGQAADPDALFFIMIGVNDYLEYPLSDKPEATIDVNNVASSTVSNISQIVSGLAETGAKRFLIITAQEPAIMPYIKTRSYIKSAAEYQADLNTNLPATMEELKKKYKLEVTMFDLIALDAQIMKDPSRYGLKNLTNACLSGDTPPTPCASPDDYFFWDDIHPTRHVHQIWGEAFAALYTK